MTSRRSRRRSPQRAFTLLELVVVITIIAALAGLVISQVGMLGRSTDMAATAKNQADVANNLQLFFVLQRRYPQGMDSLLVSTGAGVAPTGVYVPVDDPVTGDQIAGLPDSGPHLDRDLAIGTLTAGQRRSLTRLGLDFVYDHDTTTIGLNSNNSGVYQRVLDSSDPNMAVALVVEGSDAAIRALPATQGVYPTGTTLVAVGVGPSSSCIPKTMLNAPIYPGNDGSYYGRYVAIFQVYESGERANLVGVCDSYGRFPDYTIQQFNESLPNGARRG